MMRLLAAFGVLSWSAAQTLATYNLVQSYSGSNFFQGWDFFDGFDNTTNGAFGSTTYDHDGLGRSS